MGRPAEAAAEGATPQHASRLRRSGELLLIFVAAPGLLSLASAERRWIVAPCIFLGAALCIALVRDEPGWSWRSVFAGSGSRRELGPLLLRAVLVPAGLLALLCLTGHAPSFRMPREQPLVWLAVLALYPLLSALPQELLYRPFFFHRYGDLFPSAAARACASALLFAWGHLLVHSPSALLLSAAAGALLSLTWLRSRSLWLVTLEHSLYGAFAFTAGVGGMFVNGTRLVSSVLR